MKLLMTTILALSMVIPSYAQLTINGVTLPSTVKVGDATANLNGGGIRKKLFFKLYVGGLLSERKINRC